MTISDIFYVYYSNNIVVVFSFIRIPAINNLLIFTYVP